MALASGTYELGPAQGTLLIKTGREGAAARMGHDLTLVAGTWSATVTIDAGQPANSTVRATVDAGSITVRDGSGGATSLSDKQRGDIEKNMRQKVLEVDKHPTITFQSTSVEGGAAPAKLHGDLTICGATRPVTLDVEANDPSGRVTASTHIAQSDFGIKQFSAMLGALKVKDVVGLSCEVTFPG